MEIVIADPNEQSCSHLTLLLKSLCPSARISGFTDPMFLVQHCLTHRVDAVFTEVAMPGPVDGLTLISMLRKRYPRIKSYIVTGSEQYRALAAPLQVDGYLLKPLEEARLRDAMGGAQAAQPEQKAQAAGAPAGKICEEELE